MADFLTLNIPMGISKLPETSINIYKELQADFTALVTSALNVQLPMLEKFFDEGLVGSGNEWARRSDNDYFSHPGLTIQDRINTDLAAILLARCLGGAIQNTVVTAAESWDHVIKMDAPSDDPALPTSSVAVKLGGIDLLMAGVVVNGFSMSFAQATQPTFSADLVGTGAWKYMADVTPTPLVLPAYTPQNYMGTAAAIECSFNDGTLLNLHTVGRLKSFSFSVANNALTGDRRAGDPLRTPADINSGAYVNRLTRGNRTVSASVQVYIDGNKREWTDHLNNTSITNFKFKSKGFLIADGPDSHEFEVTIPKAVFSDASVSDEGGKLCLSLTITPLFLAGEDGLITARIRNALATLS